MIVPQYWAEGRIQERSAGRQITVRRFGWSDQSAEAAQAHADARTREAFDRIAAGEELDRREPRWTYNGAEGLPIREEIVEHDGDTVITRVGYGARCLNTPDVLFLDIDFESPPPRRQSTGLLSAAVAGGVMGWATHSWVIGLLTALAVFLVLLPLRLRRRRQAQAQAEMPAEEQAARSRIDAFLNENPDWHLRLYRTPAGLRALAMHRTFSPHEPVVAECFERLGVDKLYARMCHNQNCFRARVSPKPWRIGVSDRLRPGSGNWPVPEEMMPAREAWIARYEKAALGHAACRFIAALGSGTVDPAAQAVQQRHDALCRAGSELPIA